MAKTKLKILGASATKGGLTLIINKYFYSVCTLDFEAGIVSNGRGPIGGYSVTISKGRYYFNEL